MATLNFSIVLTAFDAGSQGSLRKHVDWRRALQGMQVQAPQDPVYRIPPGATQTIFNGVRSTSLDNTTQLTLSLSPLASNRYRFTWTGGTAPVFRTDRALATAGHTLTLALPGNGTMSVSSSTVGDFASVQVADSVWIPGATTGDPAGPFDELNTGLWTVLAKDGTSTQLQLQRPAGSDFAAFAQAVVVVANSNFQAFSAAGVQVGDKVDISAGFSTPVLQTFTVDRLTAKWFEALATGPLPIAQVATPGTAGIQFYVSTKRVVYVEVDQEAILRFNGDTSNTGRISPFAAGSPDGVGWDTRSGPVWQLDIVNRSTETMNALVISAE